jgi:hypothetical protein
VLLLQVKKYAIFKRRELAFSTSRRRKHRNGKGGKILFGKRCQVLKTLAALNEIVKT